MLLVTTPAQAVMHRIDVSAVEITDADIDFNGTVVDKETGEELIGVTIAIKKGTSIVGGTATNADGKFSLKISEKDYTVQISYTGYKTIILRPKDIKSGMKIQMESDSKLINEVVVTGFFDKNKNTFTGSVTQLKAEDLKLVTGTDIVSAIAALTPGLQLQVNSAQGSNPN